MLMGTCVDLSGAVYASWPPALVPPPDSRAGLEHGRGKKGDYKALDDIWVSDNAAVRGGFTGLGRVWRSAWHL
jgi:hypothetical protein